MFEEFLSEGPTLLFDELEELLLVELFGFPDPDLLVLLVEPIFFPALAPEVAAVTAVEAANDEVFLVPEFPLEDELLLEDLFLPPFTVNSSSTVSSRKPFVVKLEIKSLNVFCCFSNFVFNIYKSLFLYIFGIPPGAVFVNIFIVKMAGIIFSRVARHYYLTIAGNVT